MTDQANNQPAFVATEPGPLVVLRPRHIMPRMEQEYRIDHYPASIGRHRANDIELPFESVSRYHARLEAEGEHVRVVDLRSSNGTFVNGARVDAQSIQDQDVIAFGSVEFTVSRAMPAAPKKPAIKAQAWPGFESQSIHFLPVESAGGVQEVIDADRSEESSRLARLDKDISDGEGIRKARERLVNLYRLQDILRTERDSMKVFERVLELLFECVPIDRGAVLIGEGIGVHPAATRFRSEMQKINKEESIGIPKSILAKCLKEKVAVLTTNASQDQRFAASESILFNRVQSAICVPLISYHAFFGFIYIDTANAVRQFTRDDLEFVASFGGEIASHLFTERIQEEQLRNERMAAIGQTITGMAHNIKNVLLLSKGGMDLMSKRLAEHNYDSLEETWGLVQRGIDRINQMVKDMLDYSRQRKVEKSMCQVNDLLTEIRDTFAEELMKRGVACELDLDPACPLIPIDIDGLDKAIMNLLTNAIEACPETTGVVAIRTRLGADGTLAIEVADNGSGIPEDLLPKIFAPFFTTKGARGTGLGLPMTKKYIEDMDGKIEVKSVQFEGTTFTITFRTGSGELRFDDGSPGEPGRTSPDGV